MDIKFHPTFYNGYNYLSMVVKGPLLAICTFSLSLQLAVPMTFKSDTQGTYIDLHTEIYSDVIMNAIETGVSIVHSTIWSGADQRKYQSAASLAFVREELTIDR